jgi:hypothetical protein
MTACASTYQCAAKVSEEVINVTTVTQLSCDLPSTADITHDGFQCTFERLGVHHNFSQMGMDIAPGLGLGFRARA